MGKINKKIWQALTLSLLLTYILLYVNLGQASSGITYYPPYPQGKVGILSPEVGWQVNIGDNKITKAYFYLNNKEYVAKYDKTRNTFYLNTTLPVGDYEVIAKITLNGYWEIKEKWSFSIVPKALAKLPTPLTYQQKGIDLANDYRHLLNLPTFLFHNGINLAAQKHAEYQNLNQILTHTEETNKNDFFGETVLDRVNYYGFYGNAAEDVSFTYSQLEAIDGLFDAPYHRFPFLDPSLIYFGYGSKGNYYALNFGSKNIQNEILFISYPFPNANYVPTFWEDNETPDPLRFYVNRLKRVGYPITFGFYGEGVEGIKITTAKLYEAGGKEVDFYLNWPKKSGGNDDHLQHEVIIIPKSPLKNNLTYTVSVDYILIVNGQEYPDQKTWKFTTEKVDGIGKELLHKQVEYPTGVNAKQIEFRIGQRYMWVDNSDYPLDVAAFIENDRAMVPFRALGEAMGAEITWDDVNKKAIFQKNNTVIELPIAKNYAIINGKIITLDQGAIIKNNRTFVPSRFVSENLGAKVEWFESGQEVEIIIGE